ncbi:MAG: outer membrane beta-barrel protein [Bdellovibrionota bacterium]
MKTQLKFWMLLAPALVCLGVGQAAERTVSRFGLSVGYGAPNYSSYSYAGGASISGRGHAAQARIEWMPLRLPVGTFSIGLGVGFAVSPRTVTVARSAPTAEELRKDSGIEAVDRSNVLVSIPVETYLTYRAELIDDQIVVPFARVGPSVTFVRQASNSGAPERAGKFFGLEYAAGLQILLNGIDSAAAKTLRINAGLQQTYLTVEYARKADLGVKNPDAFDLRGDVIRAGLRFQF